MILQQVPIHSNIYRLRLCNDLILFSFKINDCCFIQKYQKIISCKNTVNFFRETIVKIVINYLLTHKEISAFFLSFFSNFINIVVINFEEGSFSSFLQQIFKKQDLVYMFYIFFFALLIIINYFLITENL